MPPPLRTWLPAATLALLPWAGWTTRLAWVCDDAWISFRYGRNWALGHGPVYNLDGSPPVEGYSDLAWVALAALVEAVGGRPELVLPAVSAACGAAVILLVARTAAALGASAPGVFLAALACGLSPAFGAWSTGGLETMPTTLALFVLAERLLVAGDARAASIAAVALALLRVEGPAWVGLTSLLALGAWAARGRPAGGARPALVVLGVLVGVVVAHTAFRLGFYGDWIANTARAKVALGPERLVRGLKHVVGTWVNLPGLALPLAGAVAARRGPPERAALALLALAVPAYAVAIGGDYMAFGRMLVTGLPLAAVLLGLMVRRPLPAVVLVALLGAGALPGAGVELAPKPLRQALQWRNSYPKVDTELAMWSFMVDNARSWERQGRMLRAATEPGDSIVTGAIGARGYFSERTILDRGGLVSREPNTAPPETSASRVSPGHDRTVPRAFFLPMRPSVLDFAVVDPAGGLRKAMQAAGDLEGRHLEPYGPRARLVTLDGDARLVVLLRRAPDADTARAWRAGVAEHLQQVLAGPATPAP